MKVCKMVKNFSVESEFEAFAKMVKPAKYICSTCARTAKEEDNLCKPLKLPKKKELK